MKTRTQDIESREVVRLQEKWSLSILNRRIEYSNRPLKTRWWVKVLLKCLWIGARWQTRVTWNMPVDIPLLMLNPSILPVCPTNIQHNTTSTTRVRTTCTMATSPTNDSALLKALVCSARNFQYQYLFIYCIRIVHSLLGTELALWSRRLKRSYYSSLKVCFWIL